MRFQTILKAGLASAALAGLAFSMPSAQAMTPAPAALAPASTPVCTPDNCDSLFEYYSDATYTVRVGEYEDGPCGQIDNGVHTQYVKRFVRTC